MKHYCGAIDTGGYLDCGCEGCTDCVPNYVRIIDEQTKTALLFCLTCSMKEVENE